MESISSRVLIWTVVEALVLVGVAYWQVGQPRSGRAHHEMNECRLHHGLNAPPCPQITGRLHLQVLRDEAHDIDERSWSWSGGLTQNPSKAIHTRAMHAMNTDRRTDDVKKKEPNQ